jgi:hypothetical protein
MNWNWRHKLTFSFLPLIACLIFFKKERQHEEISIPKPIQRHVASAKDNQIARQKIVDPKRIRVIRGKTLDHSLLRNRIPQSIEDTFDKNPKIKISRGHDFLERILALPKENYKPSMGEVVKKDDQYIYFKSESQEGASPVAISRLSNTLYPISSILHIKEASTALKDEILAKGHKQYYYHPHLKFLSIETVSDQVMKTYNDLTQAGYQVELEVLKPSHRPN